MVSGKYLFYLISGFNDLIDSSTSQFGLVLYSILRGQSGTVGGIAYEI